MSTNPNDAVGTNGAFGGRTSVNAFNDVLGTFRSRGILSGWGISASSGMTVNVGGNGTTRDVAVAEDANGNKTTINNISASPIAVTLDSAPASNSRYDAIVAYVDKPPVGNATQDNPECCGIIPVTGTAASTPAYPDDGAIRSAITADGASGSTAYYAVLGYVLVASGTTVITSGMIMAGSLAPLASGQVDSTAIANGAVNTSNIANNAVTSQKIDWTTMGGVERIGDVTNVFASFNTNGQHLIQFPNGMVYVNLTFNGVSMSANSPVNVFVLPNDLVPSKNQVLSASSYIKSYGGAWINAGDKRLKAWVGNAISNSELNICGWYMISG